MSMQNFVTDLIEELLNDKELALTEKDIRFYDKGTTAETDEDIDSHIRWRSARYFNEYSNIVRNSILIVQLPFGKGVEYVNFSVGEFYRLYRKDGMKKVLPAIKNDIKSVKSMAAQNLELLNQLRDYEAIKNQLIIRPLNYDDNDKVLTNGIYRRIGDIALVLYISLGRTRQGTSQNIISTMVRKDMFCTWNADREDAFNWALENTMRLQPPEFFYVAGGHKSKMKSGHVPFAEAENAGIDFDDPLAPSLTTEQEVNGAVAAFYPGILERLYRMVGGDFYLVFSSTYDVHVHPVNGMAKVSSMRSTLADMNRDMNSREEILSRKIYRYNGEKKEIAEV